MFIVFVKHTTGYKLSPKFFWHFPATGVLGNFNHSIYKDYLAYHSQKEKDQHVQNDFQITHCISSLLQE